MDNGSPRKRVRSRWDVATRVLRPRRISDGAHKRWATLGSTTAGAIDQSVDIFCSGMYRACSTWQYEVVAHILERRDKGRRLGYLNGEQFKELVRNHAATSSGSGWRVLKSHEGARSFSRALAEGRGLAVYAFRDVRDVVFSLMHKRGLTFEQLLRQGMIHQVLANDRFWMRQPNVLVQRYEAILSDPVGGVRSLADHLRIDLEGGEAEHIANEYSLESNKTRTEALRHRLEQVGVDLNEAANAQICDSTTLLHWNHVRSGGSGSWLAEATPRQRLILRRLCGRWLKERGYPLIPAGSDSGLVRDTSIGVRDRFRIEADLLVGWLNYQVRTASQRFPRLALTVKRLLGIPTPFQVGATVFSDSKAETPTKSLRR